jgi:fatty acid desaturase
MAHNTTRPPWAAQSRAPDGGGPLADSPAASASLTAGSGFAELSERIARAGLLRRRPGYYTLRIGVITVLFAAAWTGFVLLGDSWWQLATAAALGLLSAQIALVAHDLAHRQVFRLRRASEIAGRLAGNLCIGMSFGWWQDKHTRHHANPNHEGLDPDVAPNVVGGQVFPMLDGMSVT